MLVACFSLDLNLMTTFKCFSVFDLTTIIYNLGLVVGCYSLYSLYIINYSPNWLFLLKTSGGKKKSARLIRFTLFNEWINFLPSVLFQGIKITHS